MSSADNLCKQFRLRPGPTVCCAWSGSKLFDTLMLFTKEYFEKMDVENISRQQKIIMKNYPACRELMRDYCTCEAIMLYIAAVYTVTEESFYVTQISLATNLIMTSLLYDCFQLLRPCSTVPLLLTSEQLFNTLSANH